MRVRSFFLRVNYFQLSSSRSNGFNPSKDRFKTSAGLPVQSTVIRARRIEEVKGSYKAASLRVRERRKKRGRYDQSRPRCISLSPSNELGVLAPNHGNTSLQLITRVGGKQEENIGSPFRQWILDFLILFSLITIYSNSGDFI